MMRLPKFTYLRPKTVREAVRMAADHGADAMYVAGGTDLYPGMKRRQWTPKVVIGLSRLRDLGRMTGTPSEGLGLGPGLTLTDVCEDATIRSGYPALARAVETISTPILRNMGTIGGNVLLDTRCNYYNQNYEWRRGINFCMKKDGTICWVAPSSPRCWAVQSSDSVPVLVAMGARLKFVSKDGDRMIEAKDLYLDDGIQYVSKKPDELLVEIRLPPADGWRATYRKLRRRGAFDFPVLSVGACAWFDRSAVKDIKIVLGAVGSRPIESVEAQKAVIGRSLSVETIQAAAEVAFRAAKPLDNTDFAMGWRKDMVRVFVAQALNDLR